MAKQIEDFYEFFHDYLKGKVCRVESIVHEVKIVYYYAKVLT